MVSDVRSISIGEHIDIIKGKKPKQVFDLPIDEFTKPYVLAGSFNSKGYSSFTNDTSCKSCEEDDILLLWDGSRAGRVAIGLSGYIGSTIAALKVKNKDFINPSFLYYNLKFKNDYIEKNTAGTGIPHVQKDIIQKLKIPLFSIHQQEKIVSILSCVDEAIEKTESILKKTEELKKGLMQQLLTKGIGHTELKKTDIGEIPSDWRMGLITDFCKEIFLGLTSKVDYVEENGIPLVRATDINKGVLNLKKARLISKAQHEKLTRRRKAELGDILVSKSGNLGTIALVDTDREFSIYESIICLKPQNTVLHPEFLMWYLRSSKTQQRMLGDKVGSSVGHLNLTQFRNLIIAIPRIDEQLKIAEILNSIQGKIIKEQQKLFKLQFIHKGLMQSLLTGKVRVKVDGDEVAQI